MNTYIIAAARSPRGRGNAKSSLKALTPIALAAQVLRHLLSATAAKGAPEPAKPDTCPKANALALDDLLIGCATQFGEQGSNLARLIGIAADLSDQVPAATINRACCSGLSAVIMAALKVQAEAGMHGVAVAGGVEMMSRVALASDQGSLFFDHAFNREHGIVPLGIAADAIASQFGFTRQACDAYAARSQQRALAAREQGRFGGIVPIVGAKGELLLAQDENIRPGNTAEYLATLAPAFAELGRQSSGSNPHPEQNPEQTTSYDVQIAARLGLDGVNHVHHAGNSPIAADAAAFVLLANSEAVKRHQWQPRARIVAFAECGINRSLALTGAVEASRKALANAKLQVADIDLFEINEAFAATMLHYAEAMQIGFERLNVNGGTLAFGHAMGATGAILVGMALEELERRQARYALVAISGAAGLASAVIIERIV
jgi:acetyl-CoA C-acetyltransferase